MNQSIFHKAKSEGPLYALFLNYTLKKSPTTSKTVMCEKTGQFPLYGSACGVVVTGNEDGSHHCVAHTFANLLHFGVTVPPITDLYWVGDAGPGATRSRWKR